jgi:septal ring factor EnvC (AmiA/AmiB activator)
MIGWVSYMLVASYPMFLSYMRAFAAELCSLVILRYQSLSSAPHLSFSLLLPHLSRALYSLSDQYVTEIVEVESSGSQQAVTEAQAKSAALQEQLSLQRQLLRELETQLYESQRTSTQLRAQVHT